MEFVAISFQIKRGNTTRTDHEMIFDGKAEEWIDKLHKEANSHGIEVEYCVPHYFSSDQKQRDPSDIVKDFKNYI